MNESHCTYPGDRDGALIACLYDDDAGDRAARMAFESHVAACARCADDLAALRGVRTQLARWAPPEPSFTHATLPSAISHQPWWRTMPAWAQVAAALLFLGAAAGIANLDVRYDANGLSVRTGWSREAPGAPAASAAIPAARRDAEDPWRADVAALQRQLNEMRAAQASMVSASARMQPARVASAADADVVRRVRALLEESERRQKSEIALRVAELMRDVQAQRQADLVKIDRTLGAVENRVGVEVMRDRQKLNTLLIRTSGVSRE
jgi:hypothetical protein